MAWTSPQTFVTGQIVTASDLNTDIKDNMTHVYGSIATFTPTVTQSGSVTLTTATGRYRHVGHTCYLHCAFDFGGTGTGGNAIIVGAVPAAIAPRVSGVFSSSTADGDTGTGIYFDSGTAVYSLISFFATSSTIQFYEANTISGAVMGVGPATAIATADSLNLTIVYETSAASA